MLFLFVSCCVPHIQHNTKQDPEADKVNDLQQQLKEAMRRNSQVNVGSFVLFFTDRPPAFLDAARAAGEGPQGNRGRRTSALYEQAAGCNAGVCMCAFIYGEIDEFLLVMVQSRLDELEGNQTRMDEMELMLKQPQQEKKSQI